MSIVPDTKVLYYKLITQDYSRESRGIYLKLRYKKLNERASSITVHLKYRDKELIPPSTYDVSTMGVNESKIIEISKTYYQLPVLETIDAIGVMLNVSEEKIFKIYASRPVLIMGYGTYGSKIRLYNNITGELIGEYAVVDVTGDGYGVVALIVTTSAEEVEVKTEPVGLDYYDIVWIRYLDLQRIRKSCLLLIEETRGEKQQTMYQTIQGYMIKVTIAVVTFEVTELLGGL